MNVLIKGVDMPKNCDECMFHWHGDGTTYCLAQSRLHNLHHIKWPEVTTREAADVFREDTCPLVELPDKHGRLIDADALEADTDYEDGNYYGFSIGQIVDAPTIVEADGEV